MTDEEKQKCDKRVWRRFDATRCHRNASVERNGKHYCKQHDPVSVAAKRAALEEKWREKQQAHTERYRLQADDNLVAAWLRKNKPGVFQDALNAAKSQAKISPLKGDETPAGPQTEKILGE